MSLTLKRCEGDWLGEDGATVDILPLSPSLMSKLQQALTNAGKETTHEPRRVFWKEDL